MAGSGAVCLSMGWHQSCNARGSQSDGTAFCQRPSQVWKGVCLTCYPALVPINLKSKGRSRKLHILIASKCSQSQAQVTAPGLTEELMFPFLGSLGHLGSPYPILTAHKELPSATAWDPDSLPHSVGEPAATSQPLREETRSWIQSSATWKV